MRNTLPDSLDSPWPSDILKFSSTTLRSASALWPSGMTTAVSAGLYSAGFWHRISSPQAFTQARVASAWRRWRANTFCKPSSWRMSHASDSP
ncbi:hypothetical protein D3C86_1688220 [compost metagenome]